MWIAFCLQRAWLRRRLLTRYLPCSSFLNPTHDWNRTNSQIEKSLPIEGASELSGPGTVQLSAEDRTVGEERNAERQLTGRSSRWCLMHLTRSKRAPLQFCDGFDRQTTMGGGTPDRIGRSRDWAQLNRSAGLSRRLRICVFDYVGATLGCSAATAAAVLTNGERRIVRRLSTGIVIRRSAMRFLSLSACDPSCSLVVEHQSLRRTPRANASASPANMRRQSRRSRLSCVPTTEGWSADSTARPAFTSGEQTSELSFAH